MTHRRSKSILLLLSLALAALALMSWTQSWFTVVLSDPGSAHPSLSVAGDVTAPALSALALASLAATGALAIAGAVFRMILSALQLLLGASITLSAVLAISAPVTAVAPAVTTTTGVTGDGPVAAMIGSITASAWPFVAVACGVLIAGSALVVLVTGRWWPNSGRKYQPVRFDNAEPGGSAISDWDSLSGGGDPTSSG